MKMVPNGLTPLRLATVILSKFEGPGFRLKSALSGLKICQNNVVGYVVVRARYVLWHLCDSAATKKTCHPIHHQSHKDRTANCDHEWATTETSKLKTEIEVRMV
jgi:hypothetical protein